MCIRDRYEGKPGLGAYNHENHEYFAVTPPAEYADMEIADLELLAHVVSINLWAPTWTGYDVAVHTDNQACWYLLKNGRSRQDRRLHMSRSIATAGIKSQFRLISEWIPTTENNLADALSRFGDPVQRSKFHEHCALLNNIPRPREIAPAHFVFN